MKGINVDGNSEETIGTKYRPGTPEATEPAVPECPGGYVRERCQVGRNTCVPRALEGIGLPLQVL